MKYAGTTQTCCTPQFRSIVNSIYKVEINWSSKYIVLLTAVKDAPCLKGNALVNIIIF